MPGYRIDVYEIRNDFFGEMITVAGLVTGRDVIAQLAGKDLGKVLILPDTMIRCYGDVFLDDIKVSEVETTLHCKADIVKSNGADLIRKVLEYT